MKLPLFGKKEKAIKEFSMKELYDSDNFKALQMTFGNTPCSLMFVTPEEVKIDLGAGVKLSPVPEAQFKYGSGKTQRCVIIDHKTLVDRFIPPEEKPTYFASNAAYASGTVLTNSTTSFISIDTGQEIRVDTPKGKFTLKATNEGLELEPKPHYLEKPKKTRRPKDLERGFRPSVRKQPSSKPL